MARRPKDPAPHAGTGDDQAIAPLPSGTVSFLLTDIEGSTQRWERHRVAMQKAVRRHDKLMRTAIEMHRGFVFKTVGDAFCAVFARAEDGVGAALEAQRVLAAEDFSAVDGLQVRMALHAGTADEREGDYLGPAVNRVARLLALARGGQILVSGVAAELVHDQLPEGAVLSDLGQHRLEDLAELERVHQLLAPGLRREFPALRSRASVPSNLPLQLTSFVGRAAEVAEVDGLLQKHRFVTLTGAGGIGKTRLALQVGTKARERYADGVWFVELAPVADASLVPNAIAAVLALQELPNRPMIETLLAYLRNKTLLLVLDNCEHVLAETANAVDAILRGCPQVAILATSLESVGIGGEQTYRTPSLGIPLDASMHAFSASEAMACGSVALFVDRAQSADTRFELTDVNAPTVAHICKRLDGIALAIELAAARLKIFTVAVLDEKLDQRFRILKHGSRTAPARQQTLHALIGWSYELLSAQERALFRRLAIFAGDFTFDLVASICGGAAIADFEVLDVLSSLVEKSLVQIEIAGDDRRYRLLESTRAYAREKLADRGELEATARAHAIGYLELAQRSATAFETMPDRAWNALAEPEFENWRAALEWSLGLRRDVSLGQRLAGTLSPVWTSRAAVEGRRWIRAALETVDAQTPPDVVAHLELADANVAMYLTLWKAMLAAATRALELFEQVGDARGTTEAQIIAGRAFALLGKAAQSEALLAQPVERCLTLEVPRLTGLALESLAMARMTAGDVEGSRPLYAKALSIFEAIGAEQSMSNVAANLAGTEFRGGDAAAALRLATDALAKYRMLNNPRTALVLCNMAAYLIALDRLSEARLRAREALAVACERHMDVQVAWALQHLAAIAALRHAEDPERLRGDRRLAARLVGFVDMRLMALDTPRKFTEQQEYAALLAALRGALGADEFSTLDAEGGAWSEEYALAQAREI